MNPDDIPKEDLVQLCMKLNKRMQSMESKGTELSKKIKSLKSEKKDLLDILKECLSIPLILQNDEAPRDA